MTVAEAIKLGSKHALHTTEPHLRSGSRYISTTGTYVIIAGLVTVPWILAFIVIGLQTGFIQRTAMRFGLIASERDARTDNRSVISEMEPVFTIHRILDISPPHRHVQPAAMHCCSICLEEIVTEQLVRCLPCMHTFHDICAAEWLVITPSCPLCRSLVSP